MVCVSLIRRICTALVAALLLAASVSFGQAEGGSAADAEMGTRVRTVLSDPSFQTALPLEGTGERTDWGPDLDLSGPGERRQPRSGERQQPRSGERQQPRSDRATPSAPAADRAVVTGPEPRPFGGTVVRVFLWILLGALLLALGVAAVDAVSRSRRRRFTVADEPAATPGVKDHRGPSADEVESLARAGRYAEAVHLLLQRALAQLEQRTGPLPRSFTSREILRRSGLDPPDRRPLETLVQTVERSWFGGLPLARDEYERCNAACERLAGVRGAA
jgi:hypothetical protein